MPRVAPLSREELPPELDQIFTEGEAMMGFVPNDGLIMAHRPELLGAILQLTRAVYAPGRVDLALKKLVGLVASSAAGCRYCTAHVGRGADVEGVGAEKLDAIWEFERSPLFSDAERAALRLAQAAAVTPSAVTDDHFKELRRHFDDAQIVEVVAVLSFFGFLNRWNATLATELEDLPRAFAEARFSKHGWTPGPHVGAEEDASNEPTD